MFKLDMQALREAAHVPPPAAQPLAELATIATLAISQPTDVVTFDLMAARLMAAAMRRCDQFNDSDKARQDWQRDIADTPPELRADLYQHLRAQLPPAPPRPAPAAAPRPPAPMSWSDLAQPWRAADAAYLAHWGQCPACKAAATGHADRCATGQHLHHTYLTALAST